MRKAASPRVLSLCALGVAGTLLVSSCAARPGEAPTIPTAGETTTQSLAPPQTSQKNPIVIGVDQFSGNINPHLIGSQDFTTQFVASMVFPSMFITPAVSPELLNAEASYATVMDTNVLKSVELVDNTGQSFLLTAENDTELSGGMLPGMASPPVHLTYTLQHTAQWSDGTPITIADFRYLWEQMSAQTGVVLSEAYAQIVDVSGSAGVVSVDFEQPVEQWQELFNFLLPAHAYRDSIAGFQKSFADGAVTTAGRYDVKSLDSERGRIVLKRNERYWGDSPAVNDEIQIMKVGSEDSVAQVLRTDALQYYAAIPTEMSETIFGSVPGISTLYQPLGSQMNLVLDTQSSVLQDQALRAYLMSIVDPQQTAQIASGQSSPQRPSFPRQDGIQPFEVEAEYYLQQLVESTSVEPLVIAVLEDQHSSLIAARNIVDQLVKRGIKAVAVEYSSEDFYSLDEIDMRVLWQLNAHNPLQLVEQYLCKTPDGNYANSYNTGGNVSGICIPELDTILNAVYGLGLNPDQARQAEALIAQDSVLLPLLSDQLFTAARFNMNGPHGVTGADYSAWPVSAYSGIFITAPRWTKEDADDSSGAQ